MNLYITENIKRLRLQRGITQEKLAARLNVSAAAVSKWERGETLPDISLIIPLAGAFGVSTDALLGVDKDKMQEKKQWYLAEKTRLNNIGDDFAAFELICRAYQEFPHDWQLICEYVCLLCIDPHYMDSPFGAAAQNHQRAGERTCAENRKFGRGLGSRSKNSFIRKRNCTFDASV